MTEFLQDNNLPTKALLIVDNASSHKIDVQDNNFRIIFLPPNATALIQPLDQNVLRSTKLRYRNKLISHIISSDLNVIVALKNIDLKIVFEFLASAWYSLSVDLIANAWIPLLSPDEDTTTNVVTMDESSDSDAEMSMTVAEIANRQTENNNILNQNQSDTELDDLAIERDESILQDVGITRSLLSELDPTSTDYSIEEIINWNDDTVGHGYFEDDDHDDEDEDGTDDESNNNKHMIDRISHQQGFEALNVVHDYLIHV